MLHGVHYGVSLEVVVLKMKRIAMWVAWVLMALSYAAAWPEPVQILTGLAMLVMVLLSLRDELRGDRNSARI